MTRIPISDSLIRYVRIWLLIGSFGILFILLFFLLFLSGEKTALFFWNLCWGLFCLLFVFLMFLVIWYPYKFWENYRVYSDPQFLTIQKGVFRKRVDRVPVKNISFITEYTDPVSRYLPQKTLFLHTKGGTVHLPGLAIDAPVEEILKKEGLTWIK